MFVSKTKLRSVSRERPCPVCNGNHKCSRGSDGLILCGRRSGPQPGFVNLGPAKDETWQLYRVDSDPLLLDRDRERVRAAASSGSPRQAVDWAARAKQLASRLTPALADELCERLGLPRVALDALPSIGHDGEAWTFPEVDGGGKIIGIARRFHNGSKRMMPGSQRGLTVPDRWSERGTSLFLVEGPSDTLALSVCAISAVGRPSNTGGVEMLAGLLSDFPLDRSIIVLGENDAKPDGAWPGKDGAIRVATALAERLQRRVFWTLPPDGAKDARAWLLSRNPIPNILDSWQQIGEHLWEF